nr:hypothetical protein [Alphaproteobacteria bacterium]
MNDKSTTQQADDGRAGDVQAGAQAGAQADSLEGTLPQGQSRLRRGIGLVILLAADVVGVAGLIYWVYGRHTNVVVQDARRQADMIMITSRIDGVVPKDPTSD